MPNFNSVTIAGHIGQDPESRSLPNGDPVTSFSVAVTKKWKKDGQKQERTSWFDVVCFSHTANFVAQYFSKGQAVLLTGELQQDTWETDQGQKRSKIKIIARDIQSLGRKSEPTEENNEVPF